MHHRALAPFLALTGLAIAASAEEPRRPPAAAPPALGVIEGRPGLVAAGRRLTAIYSETYPKGLHRHNRQMAAAGVQVFVLIVRGDYKGDFFTSYFWRGPGAWGDESDRKDDLTLDRQAAEILKVRNDAFFLVRWGSMVPKGWTDRHGDHAQASETKRRREASYASRLAAAGRAQLARRIVRYVEGRPWGRRVLGYMAFGQDEGTTNLAIQDCLFDQSPVMAREFRAHLAARYKTDAALQAAWGDPNATLAAAAAPTDSPWHAARKRWMHWPDPNQTARYRDYFLTVRDMLRMQRRIELAAVKEAATRPTFVGTDALKQPMHGWLIRDAFEGAGLGMDYRNILLASGSVGVGEILDMPELDFLVTPADYTARSVGFGWEPEGIGDSLVLRGKTIFVEDDARSWATNERTTQGAWRTIAECRAGLMRNLALAASRGHIPYWMNVGRGFFDDPNVLKAVAEQVPVRQKLLTQPHTNTQHAIAMILDDASPLDEDFTSGFQHLAVLRQRTDHLALTGLPYRVYLFSDVARDDFPRFRCYLLPNLFRLTPERIALIRRKLMRDGSVVIFGPGTGITDGRRLGAERTSELLGFPLELVRKESARRVLVYGRGHRALSEVRGSLVYGDSYVYGPILQPARDLAAGGAAELGKASLWWQCNRAGLVLRELGRGAAGNGRLDGRGEGDCAVAFSMAVPIPAAVLRSLAVYGGACRWSKLGDVVAASGEMLAVHTMRPGARVIHLPKRLTVTDAVTGKVVCRDRSSFTLTLKAPDTRLFLLGQDRSESREER
jgi:hypothetical protein